MKARGPAGSFHLLIYFLTASFISKHRNINKYINSPTLNSSHSKGHSANAKIVLDEITAMILNHSVKSFHFLMRQIKVKKLSKRFGEREREGSLNLEVGYSVPKEIKKFKFCHHFLSLMSFQLCMDFFVRWSTKYILKGTYWICCP